MSPLIAALCELSCHIQFSMCHRPCLEPVFGVGTLCWRARSASILMDCTDNFLENPSTLYTSSYCVYVCVRRMEWTNRRQHRSTRNIFHFCVSTTYFLAAYFRYCRWRTPSGVTFIFEKWLCECVGNTFGNCHWKGNNAFKHILL